MNRTELCVYLTAAGAMLVLLLASVREPVERRRCGRLMIPFRKAAEKLLRSRRFCRLFPFLLWEEERVQRELSLLDPASGKREAREHSIELLQNVLCCLFLADLSALLVFAGSQQETVLVGRTIERPDYGESTQEVTLRAEPDGGTIALSVHARKYTREQAAAMERALAPRLSELIRGENPDLLHVRKNLNLVRKAKGYPFRISWSATSYAYLDTDGTVHAEDIPRDGSSSLVLTAVLSLDGNRWEEKFPVVLLPEELTKEEAFQKSVQEAAKEAEEESAEQKTLILPAAVEGTALSWQQVLEDESLSVFLLMTAAAGLVFGAGHRDLAAKVKKRERELSLDYPQLVTKLALFLGTGMAVRNAFRRIGDDYLAERKKGGEKRYVYEEILVMCHELESGVPEGAAYGKFGGRCGLRAYTRLCSLLVQNLRKGNAEILSRLQEEADAAMELRKDTARKLGEEAGTKLLVPMIMLLIVAMVMITIPAYLGFAF